MFAIGSAILTIGAIASFVCWIMVLIKMFQTEKPLIGVLGILCGLWAFIWGWMKAGTLGLKKIMLIWSACFVLTIIGYGLFVAGMAAKIQSGEIPITQPQ